MTEQADTPKDTDDGKRRRRRTSERAVDAPTVGYVPATPGMPAPVLADPVGDASAAYRQAIDRIQVTTSARILLITSAQTGPGATLTAINLGMAATRLGVRAVVIDGVETGDGPSRFLSTGAAPGLTDIASGSASLAEASRLLEIDRHHRLPVIAAGKDPAAAFEPADIADAVDRISEHADIVLVVVAADASENRAVALGAHADGSLLVVDEGRGANAADAADRMAAVGAPVAGIIERAVHKRQRRRRRR